MGTEVAAGTDRTSGADTAALVHAAVTVLWAMALLLHLLGNPALWYGDALPRVQGALPAVVAVLAVATALRPTDRRIALAATAAAALLGITRLPVLPNNLVLSVVVGVALQSSRDPATALRIAVRAGAAAYGFAALAKLNTAFLDPVTSCSTLILQRLVGSLGLPAVPGGVVRLAPWATLLVESSVAVGLFVPRLRRHAATLGVAFHGLLAYDLSQHFWDFTSALLPIFAAAAPGVVAAGVHRARRWVPGPVARVGAVVLGAVAAASGVAAAAAVVVLVGHLTWIVRGTGLLATWSAIVVAERPVAPRWARAPLPWGPLAIALVSLVVLNGATPYLQLKTGYGWNMYSNLTVAGGSSNHLVVPAADLRGDQRDLVAVERASDPLVDAYADRPVRFARVQLEAWVARTPGAEVTIRAADGGSEVLRHGAVAPARPGWLLRVAPLRPVTDECLLAYGPVG